MPSAAGKEGTGPGTGSGGAAPIRVGALSLQGDFACHRATLEALGVEAVRVTLPRDLDGLDALVIPGGESTTMLRLLETTGLRAPLERFVREKPVLGTCAGLILLAAESAPLPAPPLGVLDVTVERNAYGRQIDSFIAEVEPVVFAGPMTGVFIRAPRILRVGGGVQVVARRAGTGGARVEERPGADRAGARDPGGHGEGPRASAGPPAAGEPVGVRSGRTVGLCFHPELTHDLRFHRWFLTEVAGLPVPNGARSRPSAPVTAGSRRGR